MRKQVEMTMAKPPAEVGPAVSNRSRRYQKAAALLQKWMGEANEYDAKTWPALEQELTEDALRCWEPDEPSP
jgi:hypothetical protein